MTGLLTSDQRQAAGLIVAALTYDGAAARMLAEAHRAGVLSCDDVDTRETVEAAAAMIRKLIGDVEAVLGISPAETVRRLGLWVAAEEVPAHG